jgi:hypothetical protein
MAAFITALPHRDQTKAGGASCLPPDRKTGIKKWIHPRSIGQDADSTLTTSYLLPPASCLLPRTSYLLGTSYFLATYRVRPVTLCFLFKVLLGILLAGLVRRVSFISSHLVLSRLVSPVCRPTLAGLPTFCPIAFHLFASYSLMAASRAAL